MKRFTIRNFGAAAVVVLSFAAFALTDPLYGADTISGPLVAARVKQRAGEHNAARRILLNALSKSPNSASLLNQLGSVEQDLGEYLEAERSYLRALGACIATSNDLENIVIWGNLATLYLETNQYSKGERLREQLENVPPATFNHYPSQAGALLNIIGSLEHARNNDDDATRLYSRSILLIRQAAGPVSVDAALVRANLGFLRLDARQYESAGPLFQQAIREIEIASGAEDPALLRPLINLARCENMRHHAIAAESVAHRAVELSAKIFGERHPVTATAMLEEATALRDLRQKKLARDLKKRATAYLRGGFAGRLDRYAISLRDLTRSERR